MHWRTTYTKYGQVEKLGFLILLPGLFFAGTSLGLAVVCFVLGGWGILLGLGFLLSAWLGWKIGITIAMEFKRYSRLKPAIQDPHPHPHRRSAPRG